MKIDGGPGMIGLQHMAARAQEARKPAGLAEFKPASSSATETPPTGNNVPAPGNNLPPAATGAEQSVQKPGHATGLERAVERLQLNAVKSPEAAGLQHALEMLQRNQERGSTVDTQA